MKIIGLIPSRWQSTRFPGKPLALIDNKPMVRHVYQRVCQAQKVDDVFVATDDKRIYEAVVNFGGQALMTSADNRSGTDRLAEAAEILDLGPDDLIVNIQGDQPLLNPSSIDAMVRPFGQAPTIEMSTLAFRIVDQREITNPKDVKVVFDNHGFALYFSRSPIPCARDAADNLAIYKHLGFYAYKRRFLETFRQLSTGRLEEIEKLEQLRVLEHGYSIKVVITPHDSPEVDLPEDIARIEKLLANSKRNRLNEEC